MRVIPLLVIVAFMAFSIRLVDFSLGLSSLSGSAMAKDETHAAAEAPAESSELAQAAQEMAQMDDGEDLSEMHEEEERAAPSKSTEGIQWRDAKDEVAGVENVRKDVREDYAERRKQLEQKERNLITREALLSAAEQEIDVKYKELLKLRSEIEDLLGQQSEAEKARIDSLVKIYEGMKPKDAARIFDTLDLDVLVAVMSKMSERKLSPILAAMNPERARTVTIMLAEEKQLPELP